MAHTLDVRVLEADRRVLLHGDGRDARPHEAGAEHAEQLHRMRLGDGRLDAGILLERRCGEEEEDELARDVAGGELAEGARLLAEACLGAPVVARLDSRQRGERRGIVAVRLRHHPFARLTEDDRAAERVVLQQHARGAAPLGATASGQLAVRELARAVDGDFEEDRRMHELVHEPHLIGLPRADVAPGEHHVERTLQTDETRQPLRAAGTRDQPELHLWEGEHRLGVIGRDTVAAGERGLEAAAEAGTVDGGNDRNRQLREPREQRLPTAAQRFGVGGVSQSEELGDVGAGEPRVRLGRREHHAAHVPLALQPCEQLAELGTECGRHLVDRFAGQVDRDDGDALGELEVQGGHQMRSTTMA